MFYSYKTDYFALVRLYAPVPIDQRLSSLVDVPESDGQPMKNILDQDFPFEFLPLPSILFR